MSQQELAALVGVSQPLISEYENGKKRPRPAIAIKIERVTGIDKNYLVFGDAE